METNSRFSNQLGILFQQFIHERKYCSHLSGETLRGYTAVFDLFLRVMPEVQSLDALKTPMLIEFFKRIDTRMRKVGKSTIKVGVKGSTIKTQWSKLNVFFGWLVNNNYLAANPLMGIRPPTPKYEDPKALDTEQLNRLYAAITLRSSNSFLLRRDTVMLSTLIYCGLRKSELLALRVSDIDLDKRQLTVVAQTSKTRNWRVLKLHPTLHLHMQDYFKARKQRDIKSSSFLVAGNADRGLSGQGLKHWVKSLCNKSGVRFHLHQLRHTFACKLAEADVNPFKIQKLLGHTSLAMTLKYIRSMRTENMEDDISKINL